MFGMVFALQSKDGEDVAIVERTEAPFLRTALFNLHPFHIEGNSRVCGTVPGANELWAPEASWSTISCLSLQFRSSAYPAIQRLIAVEKHNRTSYDDTEYDTYIVRDIIAHCTRSMPSQQISVDPWPFMIRTLDGDEFIGDRRDVQAVVEGPAWIETMGGSRFPKEYARSKVLWDMDYSFKDLLLDDRAAFQARSTFKLGLWDREDSVGGSKLLRATTQNGFPDVRPLKERATALPSANEDTSDDESHNAHV